MGWDLRLRDVTGGIPRMVVRRDALPTDVTTSNWWYPGSDATWPTGDQWAEYSDLTDRWQAADWRNASNRHLTCGMGRPLEPGDYYIGVRNDSTTGGRVLHAWKAAASAAEWRSRSRRSRSSAARPTISGLNRAACAVFKVTVPAERAIGRCDSNTHRAK